MLYSEIVAVCSQIHAKHINTLCGQNVESVNFKPGGTHSDHWTLYKGKGASDHCTPDRITHPTAVVYRLHLPSKLAAYKRRQRVVTNFDTRTEANITENFSLNLHQLNPQSIKWLYWGPKTPSASLKNSAPQMLPAVSVQLSQVYETLSYPQSGEIRWLVSVTDSYFNPLNYMVTACTTWFNINCLLTACHSQTRGFIPLKHINPLKTKRRLLYLKTQFVPHSKHFSSRL